ncbi:MAG: aryl-sulfate sulfotransferase [Actinobacteria bacterium]|nr:aryl-sulfate sulfotransferase [Actinomycetota bacterium]
MYKKDYAKSFGLTYYNEKKTYDGYTLFAPMWGNDTWLINMKGEIVHRWKFNKRPGDFPYLLSNGNLIYPERLPIPKLLFTGGCGCDCLEVDWDNNLVWKYTDTEQHHLVLRLRSGNTLFLRIEKVPSDIAKKIKGGIKGSEENGDIYGDSFREVTPDGNIVWEWKGYEHLDLDIFTICPLEERRDWTHANSCFELPNGDLLTCFRNVDLLVIIDKKTKEIKWHWGKGILSHQHMASYLDNGNILCFNNGQHRQNGSMSYSSIVEVNPKTYKIVWEYLDKRPTSFYSAVISGAQRLSNGNTLVTDGVKGRIFEITKNKEIVWEYVSPFFHTTGLDDFPGWHNWIHRAYRYPKDFNGFGDKEIDSQDCIELNLIYGPGAF